jgi:hypothetical protein
VDLAVGLARAPQRLASYRAGLRARTIEHGLGSAADFTPRFEEMLINLRMRRNSADGAASPLAATAAPLRS